MFMRAQREDVKEPPANTALEPTPAKQITKAEARRRIIGTRGLEIQTENQRKPQEFFSSRKDFKHDDSTPEGSAKKPGVVRKPLPKKFETDSNIPANS